MAQWCVSVCVGTYRCPKTSIHRNTHRVATHRGHYRQETGHKDKICQADRASPDGWVLLRQYIC